MGNLLGTETSLESPHKKPVRDLINRGVKKSNPLGTLTFVGLRALDPLLQYNLLAAGWGARLLAKVGASTIPSASAVGAFVTGVPFIDALNLPLPHLVILTLSVGSAAKQIYWLVALSAEEFTFPAAVSVSIYNTLVNSVNSLLFLAASTSVLALPRTEFPGTGLPYQLVVGASLYAVGITVETVAEIQRKAFKDRPENKGKVMKTGLWSWARHINYGGYSLWRAAYCFASSGWLGGLAMGAWQTLDFVNRAVPVIDEYCAGRYGAQWTQFKKEVPYIIIPGVY
ncbi:hypothetical protein B0T11DRAFT_303402 [Plectosphaerella cucumerina]|uniref:Steroid 5-alpha reductase C-terminal domain-containing protein n=1 Tax=Plectosphaerella cucumerina TaxID=40658 RepID=A0A8K0X7P5_9PEZI|nr:hypothetical protein B0T11DRAFT_303402 [Plectosphaerella cucumerina]